jgi:hypothetical protein
MEARRVKIVAAQLVKQGFGQEEAHLAASQGPEAVAALNAIGPDRSRETLSDSTAASSRASSLGSLPSSNASSSSSSYSTLTATAPVVAEPPAIDISWMFGNSTLGDEEGAHADEPELAAVVAEPLAIDMSWMFGNATSGDEDRAHADDAVCLPCQVTEPPAIDISWMFENPTLGDEEAAQRPAGRMPMKWASQLRHSNANVASRRSLR